jgi:acetylornithine/N-succinyldiaminopimelate aminotransferase
MIGIEITKNCGDVVTEARKQGVLINCTADTVIRLLPPLIITKEQLDVVVNVLDEALAKMSSNPKPLSDL